MRPPIDQGQIIEKLIKYNQFRHGSTLTQTQKSNLEMGICFSFCIIESFMEAIDKQLWWLQVKEEISQWDSTKTETPLHALDAMLSIEGEKPIKRGVLFEKVLSYFFYNFADTGLLSIAQLSLLQCDFLKTGGPFFCEVDGKIRTIQSYACAAGHFTAKQLKKLLQKDLCLLPAVLLLHSETHTLSVRYSNEDKVWQLYDPNDPDGVVKYARKSDCIEAIFRIFCGNHALEIEIATWNKDPVTTALLDRFQQTYDRFLDADFQGLTDGDGLEIIIKKIPEKLSFKNRSHGKTFLLVIAEDPVHCFTLNEIIFFAASTKTKYKDSFLANELLKAAVICDSAGHCAQDIIMRRGGKALLTYLSLTDFAALSVLVESAKADDAVCETMIEMLQNKYEGEPIPLASIAAVAPGEIDRLLELAKINDAVHTFFIEELEGFDGFEGDDPDETLRLIAALSARAVLAILEITVYDPSIVRRILRLSIDDSVIRENIRGMCIFESSDAKSFLRVAEVTSFDVFGETETSDVSQGPSSSRSLSTLRNSASFQFSGNESPDARLVDSLDNKKMSSEILSATLQEPMCTL